MYDYCAHGRKGTRRSRVRREANAPAPSSVQQAFRIGESFVYQSRESSVAAAIEPLPYSSKPLCIFSIFISAIHHNSSHAHTNPTRDASRYPLEYWLVLVLGVVARPTRPIRRHLISPGAIWGGFSREDR